MKGVSHTVREGDVPPPTWSAELVQCMESMHPTWKAHTLHGRKQLKHEISRFVYSIGLYNSMHLGWFLHECNIQY